VDARDARQRLDLDLPALPGSAPRARYAIRAAIAAITLDLGAVDLAVSEAVTNAVIHAYRDRDPADEPGRVRVTLDVDDDGVWIVVSDRGVGLSPRPDSPGLGLGLQVITDVCDELRIDQRTDGTSVRMRFRSRPDPETTQGW